MSTVKISSAATALAFIVGILYTAYGLLTLSNWLIYTFLPNVGAIDWLLVFVPSDPGCMIALVTVGMLFLGHVIYRARKSDVKALSCLLVGSAIGLGLLAIQLLAVVAGYADVGVLALAGEIAEYEALPDLLRPDVVLGIPSLALFAYSLKVSRAPLKVYK